MNGSKLEELEFGSMEELSGSHPVPKDHRPRLVVVTVQMSHWMTPSHHNSTSCWNSSIYLAKSRLKNQMLPIY